MGFTLLLVRWLGSQSSPMCQQLCGSCSQDLLASTSARPLSYGPSTDKNQMNTGRPFSFHILAVVADLRQAIDLL